MQNENSRVMCCVVCPLGCYSPGNTYSLNPMTMTCSELERDRPTQLTHRRRAGARIAHRHTSRRHIHTCTRTDVRRKVRLNLNITRFVRARARPFSHSLTRRRGLELDSARTAALSLAQQQQQPCAVRANERALERELGLGAPSHTCSLSMLHRQVYYHRLQLAV